MHSWVDHIMKKRVVDSINDFLSSVEQEPYLVCISGEGTKQGEGGTHGALLTHGVLGAHGTNVANLRPWWWHT